MSFPILIFDAVKFEFVLFSKFCYEGELFNMSSFPLQENKKIAESIKKYFFIV
jgi:hypothetical protein